MKGKDLKPNIGIFGRRNLGKSSLINALTGQPVAIVSDQAGTTTDPVKKSMEIFGIGPVVITDTAGIDDQGDLGNFRVAKSMEVIPNVDLAILLIAHNQFDAPELKIIQALKEYDTPYVVVHGRGDEAPLQTETLKTISKAYEGKVLEYQRNDALALQKLVAALVELMPNDAFKSKSLFKGLVKPKEVVLLITPIDSEAPEGRMILPQVMAWRDVLDLDAICISVKETELEDFLKLGIRPALSVTDSQVFGLVSKLIPQDWKLTSFSIAFARYRGNFEAFIEGTRFIDQLQNGDRILMLESCTHQISCDDIGRHKLPKWLQEFTGKKLEFDFAAGLHQFPKPIDDYALVIQCGGCVVTAKQLNSRIKPAVKRNIPVTNYGMAIGYMNGIFERVIEPFIEK